MSSSTTEAGEQSTVSAPPADVGAPRAAATATATAKPPPGEPEPSTPTVDPAALREPNTPQEARENQPRGLAPCYVGYDPTTVPSAPECRVGPAEGAERTIALIGDSHATALYPAFRRIAEERGWTIYFFAKSACPIPDVKVLRAGSTSPYGACTTWRRHLLDRLATINGLDAVVIARWMAYRTSTVQPDGSASSSSTVGAVWEAGAKRTFDRLSRVTDRIIVMEDVPWPRVDVPSCLSQHRRHVETCAFSRSGASGQDAALVHAEKAAAPEVVRHVSMTDVICPKTTCQVVSPTGQIMYRDQHHLTAGYSATLSEKLSQRLDAAID